MPVGLDGNPDPVKSAKRDALLEELVLRVSTISAHQPVLVGVDGAPGTGKSTFADELGSRLLGVGRSTVRSTTDAFHNPRSERYKRGRTSPLGYYLDSHNLAVM